MKRFLQWSGGLLAVAALSIGAFVLLTAPGGPLAASIAAQTPDQVQTVAVRPAAAILGQISASGSIAPAEIVHVVLAVDGAVQALLVEPGDVVQAGDALLRLDAADLNLAALLAELDVATAQNSLAQLQQPAKDSEIAEARAELESAQQKLTDAQTPATALEREAARARVASAWAKYNDLLAGPSAPELTSLEANLRKRAVAMQEAQRAYDKVKWAGDAGMTQESARLQEATIDYEAAKADYEIAVEPAAAADVQSALSQAKEAQQQLDDLLAKPEAADVAAASAQVAAAQTKLDRLLDGADDLELEAATIKVQSALVSLGEARKQLANAEVVAPVAGSVLTVATQEGREERSGAEVVTLADMAHLKLVVNVAEVDINKVHIDQAVEVEVDAAPGQRYTGRVTRIAPVNSGAGSAVSYAVTIALDSDLAGLLPDMTAVARFVDADIADGWLVPTASIQGAGADATVPVLRAGVVVQTPISTGAVQGEWTVVYSDDLNEGDQVVGAVRIPSVETRATENEAQGGGFPPRPPQGFGGN